MTDDHHSSQPGLPELVLRRAGPADADAIAAVLTAARAFYEREGLTAVEFTDGSGDQEQVPDVRYEWRPTELGITSAGRTNRD